MEHRGLGLGIVRTLARSMAFAIGAHRHAPLEAVHKELSELITGLDLRGLDKDSSAYKAGAYDAFAALIFATQEQMLPEGTRKVLLKRARILNAVAASPGAKQKQIATSVDMHESNLTPGLQELEELGLLEPALPAKGKGRAWQLTPWGLKAWAECAANPAEFNLDVGEIQAAHLALERVRAEVPVAVKNSGSGLAAIAAPTPLGGKLSLAGALGEATSTRASIEKLNEEGSQVRRTLEIMRTLAEELKLTALNASIESLRNGMNNTAQEIDRVRSSAEHAAKQMSQSRKFLIIDDDEAVRLALRGTLERAGFEVVEARNGEDALKNLDQHNPSVIVSDLMMPDMDGLKLLEAVKTQPGHQTTPVIMLMTGSTPQSQRKEAEAAGALVVNPFRSEELLNAVSKVLH